MLGSMKLWAPAASTDSTEKWHSSLINSSVSGSHLLKRQVPIPVYLINLDRRKDRLETMKKQLHQVAWTRMTAIDGQRLVLSEEDKRWMKAGLYPLGVNEMACLKSHRKTLQRVLEEQAPYACVLEDDVVLGERFAEYIENDTWIPEDTSLIKLETMAIPVWLKQTSRPAKGRELRILAS